MQEPAKSSISVVLLCSSLTEECRALRTGLPGLPVGRASSLLGWGGLGLAGWLLTGPLGGLGQDIQFFLFLASWNIQ